METEKKILFYAKRRFGEKMSVTFDFIRQNNKVLLKWITYIFLSISFLQAMTLNSLMKSFFDIASRRATDNYNSVLYNYGFTIFCMLLGSVIFISLLYAMMRLYNERTEGLKGITWKEICPYFMKNLKKSFLVYFILIILWGSVSLMFGFAGRIVPGIQVVFVIIALAFSIPFSLLLPVYLFEKVNVIQAFRKAIRIGFSTWGSTFGLMFVMSLIVYLMQGVLSLPFSVLWVLKLAFSLETTSTFFISPAFTLISFISSVIL